MRMEFREVPLPAPLASGPGAPMFVGEHDQMQVQVEGTFSASIQLEGRMLDGGEWVAIGSAITSPGFATVPGPLLQLRANLTYTSGDPIVTLGARMIRGNV